MRKVKGFTFDEITGHELPVSVEESNLKYATKCIFHKTKDE